MFKLFSNLYLEMKAGPERKNKNIYKNGTTVFLTVVTATIITVVIIYRFFPRPANYRTAIKKTTSLSYDLQSKNADDSMRNTFAF